MASRREQLGSERDFEGNLKFETALLASLRDESATVEQTNACAGEAAQAVARCAVLGTQDFRPGLGVCRAYGAEFFGWALEVQGGQVVCVTASKKMRFAISQFEVGMEI